VFPGGRYRIEESSQYRLDPKQVKVFEGTLSDEQAAELRKLLDSPELVKAVHRNTAEGIAMREGEIVTVAIPRDTYIQNLIYADYFEASDRFSSKSVQSGSSGIDSESWVIKPLREWIHSNIQKHKGKPLKEEVANGCSSIDSPDKRH
jgi:hypothetical protein